MLKNTLLASALALSVYTLATNAEAGHRPHGWYVALEAGVNWTIDADVNIPGPTPVEVEFDSGAAVFAEVGYRWENNWRLELEGGWRNNDVDCARVGFGACVSSNYGDITQFTQMLNFVHDIDISKHTAFSVGLGIGGAFIDVDPSAAPFFTDDDDYVFAAQAIFQLTHQLAQGMDFVLTYRFLVSDEPNFRVGPAFPIEMENENHTLTVGLRFDLDPDQQSMDPQPVVNNAPPPQVQSPPSPKQYIIYFGFNKAALTAKAMSVIQEAAAAAMHDGYVSILVVGHTDTVGSSRYNNQLSTRRANVVKKALVAQGIPAKGITASGRGETMLMVQTGDHEMESRNRRAEINVN